MNAIKSYIGGAGTGKTSKIITTLVDTIRAVTWSNHKSVLALTCMHGSRKRLSEKLKFLNSYKIQFKCLTLDSFATHIVERFRRSLNISKTITIIPGDNVVEIQEGEHTVYVSWSFIRKSFIKLMNLQLVKDFIAVSYPVIILDEFQDFEDDLLSIVKELAKCDCKFLIAGDEFQQLNTLNKSEAIEWLHTVSTPELLNIVHRTSITTIIDSATGLKNNCGIKNSLPIVIAISPELTAWKISTLIQWKNWGQRGKTLVMLFPSSPEKAPFVKKVLDRLKEPFPKNNLYACPFILEVEHGNSVNKDIEEMPQKLPKMFLQALLNSANFAVRFAAKRALKILSLRDLQELESKEFEILVGKENHNHKSYFGTNRIDNRLAMTIHAAKNREFDDVIIIWPYQAPKDLIYKRKLLYNAITRAKRNVAIFVQAKDEASFRKDTVFALFDNMETNSNKKKVAQK